MMSETPVAFSKAIMFLPSFPIIFPLRSSLSRVTSVCVVSPVTSPAYCWIAFIMISLEISCSRVLYSFFFFSMRARISFSYDCSIFSKSSSFASSFENHEISSSLPMSDCSFFSMVFLRREISRSFSERELDRFSRSSYFSSIFFSFSVSRFS